MPKHKSPEQRLHLLGHTGQIPGGGRGVLHALVDGLAIGIDPRYPLVDPRVCGSELLNVRSDVGELVVGRLEIADHALEMAGRTFYHQLGFAGAVADLNGLFVCGADFLKHGVDVARDVVSGFTDVLRQRAHFVGHHRKTSTTLPRPRRFDGRVERQQIGLRGNLLNQADDRLDA